MLGRVLDEALKNARLVIARRPTAGFVIALVVFAWFHSQAAAGQETIVYNNGTSQGQFLPISQIPPFNLQPPQEVIDSGTLADDVLVTGFEFGYFTPSPEGVDITVRFYSPAGGRDGSQTAGTIETKIAEFSFTDLPGFDPDEVEHFVFHDTSGQPFSLSSGEFKVGFVITDPVSGMILSTGGNSPNQLFSASQQVFFRVPDAHSAFHLKLLGRRLPPPSFASRRLRV